MFDRTVLKAFWYYVRYVVFVVSFIAFGVLFPLGYLAWAVTRPSGYEAPWYLFLIQFACAGMAFVFYSIALLGGFSIAKRGVIDVGADLADEVVETYKEKRGSRRMDQPG